MKNGSPRDPRSASLPFPNKNKKSLRRCAAGIFLNSGE